MPLGYRCTLNLPGLKFDGDGGFSFLDAKPCIYCINMQAKAARVMAN